MGSDRAGSDGWSIGNVEAPKVFANGPLLIGYTTSFRMGQLLQHALVPPTQTLTWDVDRWVAVDLMNAVRETYDANGWDETDSGKHVGGNFLLAVSGRCYEIQSNYSFIRTVTGEYAIGSGEMFALGSLHSTRGGDPRQRVLAALEAAAERSPSVAGPFDVREQVAS
jgi:hypothetical protein